MTRPQVTLWQFVPETRRSPDAVAWLDAAVLEDMRGGADPEAARILMQQCEAMVRRCCRRGKDCSKFGLTPDAARAWAEAWTPDFTQVFVVEVGFTADGRVCKVGANVPPLPSDACGERYIRVNHAGAWCVFREVHARPALVPRGSATDYRAIMRCRGEHYLHEWRPDFRKLTATPCLNNLALPTAVCAAPMTWVLDLSTARAPPWFGPAPDSEKE